MMKMINRAAYFSLFFFKKENFIDHTFSSTILRVKASFQEVIWDLL